MAAVRRALQKKKGKQTLMPPLRLRHETVSPSPFSCLLGNWARKNSALDLLVLAHCPFCFETFWQCASWVPHGSWWWLTPFSGGACSASCGGLGVFRNLSNGLRQRLAFLSCNDCGSSLIRRAANA